MNRRWRTPGNSVVVAVRPPDWRSGSGPEFGPGHQNSAHMDARRKRVDRHPRLVGKNAAARGIVDHCRRFECHSAIKRATDENYALGKVAVRSSFGEKKNSIT